MSAIKGDSFSLPPATNDLVTFLQREEVPEEVQKSVVKLEFPEFKSLGLPNFKQTEFHRLLGAAASELASLDKEGVAPADILASGVEVEGGKSTGTLRDQVTDFEKIHTDRHAFLNYFKSEVEPALREYLKEKGKTVAEGREGPLSIQFSDRGTWVGPLNNQSIGGTYLSGARLNRDFVESYLRREGYTTTRSTFGNIKFR